MPFLFSSETRSKTPLSCGVFLHATVVIRYTESVRNFVARQWRGMALFLISQYPMSDKRSLLIVEDDLPLKVFLAELLDREDRNILSVSTLREAYEVLGSRSVDLILLDLFLPDGSGFKLLGDIQRRNPGLKHFPEAIIITAFGNWESHIQAYKLGAQYFLDKPFKITQVKTLVERALQVDTASENA